jgi:hypothetical protein
LGLTTTSSRVEQKRALRWAMLASYLPEDVKSIERFFVKHAEYTLAQVRTSLTEQGAYQALSLSVRDRLIERWKDTQLYFQEKGCKRVCYMSMEFLLGRSLQNAIISLGLEDNYSQAMLNLGLCLEDLFDEVCLPSPSPSPSPSPLSLITFLPLLTNLLFLRLPFSSLGERCRSRKRRFG